MRLSKPERFTLVLVVFVMILGCSLPFQPIEVHPTEVSQNVILTFSALVTETAEKITPTHTPTITPIPPTTTSTATATQTATARPTLTPLPPKTGCQLISQTPRGKTRMGPREDFDAIWRIQNSGYAEWDKDKIDFRYLRGTKLQKRTDIFILPKNIKPQDTLDIRVDMAAPAEPGEYVSVWGLMDGDRLLCAVMIDIIIGE